MKYEKLFKKITRVGLPFDMRNDDPHINYGIHGFDIWFILHGPKGAVQFMISLDLHLPHIEREERPKWRTGAYYKDEKIRGYDVGYHALTPQYEGQYIRECDLLEGGKCYYDGSALASDEWVKEIFSIRGEKPENRLWDKLEEEYISRFGEPQ